MAVYFCILQTTKLRDVLIQSLEWQNIDKSPRATNMCILKKNFMFAKFLSLSLQSALSDTNE